MVDLSERVDDWKALKMDSFGELLRFGTFAVVKGDSGKDNEREVSLDISQTEETFHFFLSFVARLNPLTWLLVSYLPL